MPGAGKSTTGILLAKTLGFNFTDTDLVIQQRYSRLLQDIINNDGIETFLKYEEEAILSLDFSDTVIATGGSAVYSEKAMKKLKSAGTVIFLDAETETLCRRLNNITTRGIAMNPNQTISDLKKVRDPLYIKYADIIIKIGEETSETTVGSILKKLQIP